MSPPPVVIVEDHAIMAQALEMALRQIGYGSVQVVGAGEATLDAVTAMVSASGPGAIVILDLHLGDDHRSTPMIPALKEHGSTVLVLTAERDPAVLGECLEAGADGVLDKAQPFDQLVDLLDDAARGRSIISAAARQDLLTALGRARVRERDRWAPFKSLTAREQEILSAIVAGLSAEDIAQREVVALSTVRSHLKSVLRKLGVNSQLAAVALARAAGWPDTG